jgi:(S)-ureidoglycine aminohydrolase
LIVKAGEVTLTLAGKRKRLGPGCVVLIMPGDYYRVENKAAEPLSYYLMRYTSNHMPDLDLYRLSGGSFWVDWQEVPATADHQEGSRRMVACASVMSNRVEMELTRLDTGLSTQPPHSHRAAELLILLDHPVETHIKGALKGAQVGDVIFVESEVPHCIGNSSQEGSTYLAIRL